MSETATVPCEVWDGIATVKINRPEMPSALLSLDAALMVAINLIAACARKSGVKGHFYAKNQF
ncbi:MAG: hypothetical protein K2X51_05850 [Burkholderiales bacterium]|uniref:hypothetical protein n=1 Tax=Polaromonas sp. TaxID=1869339 RepID=UPI00352AF2D3|nr:hypothetical protein [Burkholderiales bacterium]